jgi:hypothetical protein
MGSFSGDLIYLSLFGKKLTRLQLSRKGVKHKESTLNGAILTDHPGG